MKGFTLFETLLAMAIISLISVASIYMLYLSLNLRDLSLSSAKTEEALRIFDRTLKQAATNSQSITGNSNSIYFRSKTICWSFVYSPGVKNVLYSIINQDGCTPNQNPGVGFFPTTTKVDSLNFNIINLGTGGRQIKATGTISTTLPFDVYRTNFSSSYINLID